MDSAQLRLKQPRLFVGAEQDRDLLRRNLEFLHEVVDLAHHRFRFELLVGERFDGDLDAALVSDQHLVVPTQVVMDQLVSDLNDLRRAAVVVLQADDLRAGKLLLEAEDVFHLGSAPAVD